MSEAMESKKKFGLVLPKKTGSLRMKVSSVFDNNSDDETLQNSSRPKIPQAKAKTNTDKSSVDDPSIYEYDNIYDEMKAQEVKERAPKEKKNSRYIDSLLKAASKRKKEYERRVEKKIQIERVKEGDEFKDKETFVTSSYKKKMQEIEEEEERERRENEINDMMDVTKQKDLSGFYRHFLKQTVGEEKVPIYGEDHNIKKEVLSESEGETFHSNKSECPAVSSMSKSSQKKAHINCDSDSKSSNTSSDEENKSVTGQKQCTSSRKAGTYPKHNLMDKNSYQENSSDSHLRLKSHKKTSSSEITKKRKIEISNLSEEQDSDESSDENVPEESTTQSLKEVSVNSVLTDSKLNVKEERRNIFLKRTVGTIFEEAQARYFKRVANLTSSL